MPGIESGRWPDTGAGSPYLTAAFQVADQLMLSAVPVGSGIGWEGDTLGDETAGGHTIVRQSIGPDLYGGSAGIAWFLAQVARFDSSGDAAVMAGHAMHAALASAALPPHVNDPSLFSGAGGAALAAVRVGMQIEDRTLQVRALAIAERIADMVAKAPDQWPSDVIGGLAGTVIALLAIARQSPRNDFAGEACRAACNELIRRASKEWWGWSWPEPGGRADAPALCGLAHGASGVGWALAEAGWASTLR